MTIDTVPSPRQPYAEIIHHIPINSFEVRITIFLFDSMVRSNWVGFDDYKEAERYILSKHPGIKIVPKWAGL